MTSKSGDSPSRRAQREPIRKALLQEVLAGLGDVRRARVGTAEQVLAKYKPRKKR